MPEGGQQVNPFWYLHQRQVTLFDRLNEAKKNWKVYYYDFPNSWLLLRQLEPQNIARYHHIHQFFDIDSLDESTFPDFVFIEPKYFGKDQNDDHPPHNVIKAEKLIADVYNALRSNPELWATTLLIVTFDEHGGFFDHVSPPATVAPDEKITNYSFRQFGVRVPALLISPWTSRRVEHTVFDHTSVLKYLRQKWSLGPLGERVGSSITNSIEVALREPSLRQDTVPFIRVAYADLIPPKPELEQSDPSSHQQAIHGFASFLGINSKDPSFQEPAEDPGSWLKLKKWIGTELLKSGDRLTKDYHDLQAGKVTLLTKLVKSGAAGAVRFDIPKGP
jgi:phospholipase C